VLRSQSDDRLIDLVRAGNDRAFEAIVHRYSRQLLRYCGRFLAGPRAEDAVQQTFMNAYRAMKSDERRIELRPWLYRIAHNAALNVLRSSAPAAEEPISDEIDGVERPDQAVERRQSLAEVVAAVQALPPRQRDAIVLHELEGRSYEQIAAELNVTGGAVRQLLARARSTLRAGATAVVPEWILVRIATSGGEPVVARVAEIVAAGGGAAVAAKVGTAMVVAGAVAVGATEGPRIAPGAEDERDRKRQAAGVIAPSGVSGGAGGGATSTRESTTTRTRASGERRRGADAAKRSERRRRGRDRDESRDEGFAQVGDDDRRSGGDSGPSGEDDRSGSGGGGSDDGDNSGPGGGGEDEDRSGPGDGTLVTQEPDNSGSGSSGSGSSGSGSGSGDGESSNSGPGSGSDDPVVTAPLPDDDSSGPGSGSDDRR
jgi:RNA polymerase sigma factor (sigma-70 family)